MAIAPARIQTTREAGPTSLAPIAVATYTSAPIIDPTTRLVTSNVLSLVIGSRKRPRSLCPTGRQVRSKLKTRRESDRSSDDERCSDRTLVQRRGGPRRGRRPWAWGRQDRCGRPPSRPRVFGGGAAL